MERLTVRHSGVAVIKDKSKIKEAMEKLARYEETGLEPEEVVRLGWIPAELPPETDDYILLSFENYSGLMIGRYEEDEEGGAYHLGDEGLALEHGLYVNAWMKLAEQYKDHDDAILYMINEDGVSDVYDSTYDITIHCSDEQEQQQVLEKLNRTCIPCSRELPQDHTSVLATVKHRRWICDLDGDDPEEHPEHIEVCAAYREGELFIKQAETDPDMCTYIPIAEQEENLSYPIEEVIAWMPLPET